MRKLNLVGKKYGRLRPMKALKTRRNGQILWLCLCDCERTYKALPGNLRSGNTRSCGCLKREIIKAGANLRHGEAVGGKLSSEYQSFRTAKQRCTNPRSPSYEHYGGRGIKFKFHDVEQFLAEIGRRPKNHSLDRIDNDGHYEIGNVRWATRKQQANNRRITL